MIAICIPTINRSKYLARALEFYNRKDFGGLIYIGDSSSPQERKANELLVEKYSSLNIHYYYIEGAHDGEVVERLNQNLLDVVKYVCFAGDDDFVVPEGMKKCAEFLDNNPDYIAAHGHRINFTYIGDKIRMLNVRFGYEWDETFSQLDRLREYLRSGISLSNYLHRKNIFVERYRLASSVPARYLGGELMQECVTALSGKVKLLADVISFLFYENNPERIFSFETTTLFDLINKTTWAPSYQVVLDRLTSLMEKPDKDIMNSELYLHIASIISAQFSTRYKIPEIKTSQNDCDLGDLANELGQLLKLVDQIKHEQE